MGAVNVSSSLAIAGAAGVAVVLLAVSISATVCSIMALLASSSASVMVSTLTPFFLSRLIKSASSIPLPAIPARTKAILLGAMFWATTLLLIKKLLRNK